MLFLSGLGNLRHIPLNTQINTFYSQAIKIIALQDNNNKLESSGQRQTRPSTVQNRGGESKRRSQ